MEATTLPRRRFVPEDVQFELDTLGFLAESSLAATVSLTEVLDWPATFVTAPPWMGKTYVCKQLSKHFRVCPREYQVLPFDFNHLTSFEEYAVGMDLLPSWWDTWKPATTRACWVLDALDEDARKGWNQVYSVLHHLEGLSGEQRARLSLLMFCRESEVHPRVLERLCDLYPPKAQGGLVRVRLAPMDELSARDYLGDSFGAVCDLITENSLETLAGLPTVLECLKRQRPGAKLTVVQVWRAVLCDLLRDKRSDSLLPLVEPPLESQFDAAARVASVLTLGGYGEIAGLDGRQDGVPSAENIFSPRNIKNAALRSALPHALRSSAFQRTGTGFRFRQHHVQEWFAAFALGGYGLSQIRPLLADNDGRPLESLRGVMSLLRLTTNHRDVSEWIIETHGGIPPRSDAAPWTKEQGVAALDRLQSVAATTRVGLHLWPERGLSQISAPGLGETVATRVLDRRLFLAERELLFDVATAIHAQEVAESALIITRDRRENPQLRRSAAYFISRFATDAQLLKAGEWVKKRRKRGPEADSIAAILVYALRDRSLWDFMTCVSNATPSQEDTIDAARTLWYSLQSNMTVEDARALLKSLPRAVLKESEESSLRTERGMRTLVHTALSLLESATDLSYEDCRLLMPLALADTNSEHESPLCEQAVRIIARNKAARRKLFKLGLGSCLNAEPTAYQQWRWILRAEDLEWLHGQARRRATESWIWQYLLELAHSSGIVRAERKRWRDLVEAVNPEMVCRFVAGRRKWLEQQREWRRRRRTREESIQQFRLDEIIRDSLDAPSISLHEQMVRLTWFCFEEASGRPSNVNGNWSDLDEETRQRVYQKCAEALRECQPTRIPEGREFPSAILHEGTCFIRAATDSAWPCKLTSDDIEKWLQAALIFTRPGQEAAISKCFAVNRHLTEMIFVRASDRELRTAPEFVYCLSLIPPEAWSSELSMESARMINEDAYALAPRISILELLTLRSPEAALGIAKGWLSCQGPTDDDKKKRIAAMNVLLATEPGPVLAELKKDVSESGPATLLRLDALHGHRTGARAVKLAEWPSDQLVELAQILHEALPAETDPKMRSGRVTPELELRWLRGEIHVVLFRRGASSDINGLAFLAEKYPSVRTWYEYEKAQEAANLVIERMRPPPRLSMDSIRVPVEQITRMLDDSRYRLLRSTEDLLRVLLDELGAIKETAREHLHMLYTSRRGRNPQERLGEDALQAYIKCRLGDRLPGKVLADEAKVFFLDREPLATGDQRLDLKVQAPTLDGATATVVVEVKWSDNPDVSTGLSNQLGEAYLRKLHVTHGIYLVGWNKPGRWKRSALGSRPAEPSSAAWHAALSRQADLYSGSHPGITIEPFILDLGWPESD